MGCTSTSEVENIGHTMMNRKPSVWFFGGGPGSSKGKIAEMVVQDYKFQYLSTYDIVQFQQERGGRDAERIKKIFLEKTHIPSQLLVKLMKKAIASYGIQSFLIDGFPATIQDIKEFNETLAEYVNFEGYIHINILEKKMKQCGIQAYQGDRAKMQENVNQVVKKYMNESEKVKRQYEKMHKLKVVDGNKGYEKAYEETITYLKMKSVKKPELTPILFIEFDKLKDEVPFLQCLVNKFGFNYFSITEMLQYVKANNIQPEKDQIRQYQRNKESFPPALIVKLIKIKLQRHSYQGKYCISGYPRTVNEFEEWNNCFSNTLKTIGFLTFETNKGEFKKLFQLKSKSINPNIREEKLQANYKFYQENHAQLCEYLQKHKILKAIKVEQDNSLNEMQSYIKDKGFKIRSPMNDRKIIFLSTLCSSGDSFCQIAVEEGAAVISLDKIFIWQSEQNGLYSELIKSFIQIGKPVPGNIAIQFISSRLKAQKRKGNIIVKGFPNSLQQIQCWNRQIGQSIEIEQIILYEFNRSEVEAYYKQKTEIQQSLVSKSFIQDVNIQNQHIQQEIGNRKYTILKRDQEQAKNYIQSLKQREFFP